MAQDTPRSAELAQLLRTGPFHLALRSALTERGSPSPASSTSSPSAASPSG